MLIMKLNETAMFMNQTTIGYLFRAHFRVIPNKLYKKNTQLTLFTKLIRSYDFSALLLFIFENCISFVTCGIKINVSHECGTSLRIEARLNRFYEDKECIF